MPAAIPASRLNRFFAKPLNAADNAGRLAGGSRAPARAAERRRSALSPSSTPTSRWSTSSYRRVGVVRAFLDRHWRSAEAATKAQRLAIGRSFLAWLVREGLLHASAAQKSALRRSHRRATVPARPG